MSFQPGFTFVKLGLKFWQAFRFANYPLVFLEQGLGDKWFDWHGTRFRGATTKEAQHDRI